MSTTREGSSSQPRVLSLQILLSYQMLQPITLMNIVTVCLNTHIRKNVEQPSDICVQSIANPHCSHQYSRCSSACRKISATQIVETHSYTYAYFSSTISKSIHVILFYVVVNIAIVINGLYQVVIGHNTTKSLHVFTIVHCDIEHSFNNSSVKYQDRFLLHRESSSMYHFNCPSALWYRQNIGVVTMN